MPSSQCLRYDLWKQEFSFLKRAPVVYHRRTHMRVKDSLVVALQEAIQDSYQLLDRS